MGVQKTAGERGWRGSVEPRRVRVAFPVGELMMPPVSRDPVDDGPWTDMLPTTASVMRIGRRALKDPWVKYRW